MILVVFLLLKKYVAKQGKKDGIGLDERGFALQVRGPNCQDEGGVCQKRLCSKKRTLMLLLLLRAFLAKIKQDDLQ